MWKKVDFVVLSRRIILTEPLLYVGGKTSKPQAAIYD